MALPDIKYTRLRPGEAVAPRVLELYSSVNGCSRALAERWDWEFARHPRSAEIELYGAEAAGRLIGLTVRQPVRIRCGEKTLEARFASNSMVAPDWRGQGIITRLYEEARSEGALQLSKGTAPAMYRLLKKMGYEDIEPSTFQECFLRPYDLVLCRLGCPPLTRPSEFTPERGDEMQLCSTVPDDVAEIPAGDGVIKDAAYLRWRYEDIRHRRYQIFVRRQGNRATSVLVLRVAGSTVYVVDLIWDSTSQEEPRASLAFAKRAARRMGALKMIAWFSALAPRAALRGLRFIDRGESPRFCCIGSCRAAVTDWANVNFVHGDGDIDYL